MDDALLLWINGLTAVPLIATISVVLSSRWMIPIVCGPLALYLVRKKRWVAILSVAFAMGASDALVARIIKPLVGRERPCRQVSGLVQTVRCGAGKSFPSGHAAVSFAFLVSAAPLVRFGWAVFGPIAAAIAGSRVLLGVHYPSDIGGGAVVGSLIGAGFWYGRRRFEVRTSSPDPAGLSAP